MEKKGLEIIYKTISKTSIREVTIKTNKGTELKMIRSLEEMQNSKLSVPNATVTTSEAQKVDTADKVDNKMDILSPEVGFFNRYNPKTKSQFVKLRDEVKKGMIIGTIKAMHIHHEIIADKDGKLVEFLVEQDQPVVFKQPLIRLEPLV